ncbi:lipid-A-disaccharide synthase-related protein [Almyronema epifaneia]|uniref:Lipid-A-disaccharide synthase-related protein n=1 Tax=Almyronema epifaneia S1 TaxID=2991925 RepID=A0ABW6IJD6_9CYAN
MPKRILFLSNGHGEDNHSSHIIRSLQELCPELEMAAMPIVGQGSAYQRLKIPIIGPTQTLPSGGFTYMNRLLLLKDIQSGLVGLTWRQLRAVQTYALTCDLIHATGDQVGQAFAYLSGRPYVSFISPLSALYEENLYLGPIISRLLKAPRCLTVFTRDPFTAENLRKQGLEKVRFGGIPSLDRLVPTGKDLQLQPDLPMVALLPGSRLPEAVRNFRLQLRLVREIWQRSGQIQFRAALVPDLMQQLSEMAQAEGWQHESGRLTLADQPTAEILCYADAFNDIVCQTTLVLGMAGLAVDQAVALGKPVIQVPGEGPQFTYAFAEAQTRLLGLSAQTIGKGPATAATLKLAAQRVVDTLQDSAYLEACQANGRQRLGPPGASYRIAQRLLAYLGESAADAAAQAAKAKEREITPA